MLERPLEADDRGRVYRLAVLDTRLLKQPHGHVPELSLYERWPTEARDAGWKPAAVVQAAIGPQRLGAPLTAAHVVSDVISELCVERATFTRRDVVRAVARRRRSRRRRRRATRCPAHVERIADAVLANPMVECLQAPAS